MSGLQYAGDIKIEVAQLISPTGSRTNLSTSDVLIRKWDGIVPGVSMTWDATSFPTAR